MGLWSFLFGKSVKRNLTEDYFECERFFKPSGEQIGLTVTGGLGSLTQQQESFVAQLENNYQLIVDAIIPIVEDEFRNWKPDFRIVDFKREFKPVYLNIPTCDQQPVEWEIAFETVHDRNHTFTAGMLDGEPQYVRVDG